MPDTMIRPVRAVSIAALALAIAACSSGTPSGVDKATTPARAGEPTTRSTNVSDDPIPKTETTTLAAGCFWCIEAVLERIEGVTAVTSGYMGGETENPTYKAVCSGRTGHAEVVQVEFDPNVLSFEKLLDYFWKLHDPTQLNRQGPDVGTQYRSAIFYHSDQQREIAEASKREYAKKLVDPIVTEITPASTFYEAEDYHQDYFAQNPNDYYCRINIPPKLKKTGLEK